ncbi:MAG TPA: hypothetical protein VJS44_21095 [Pyrinomonadaceae bacterium]|nr:hypothetical protein [Pyrinomonadaceae bacterium]
MRLSIGRLFFLVLMLALFFLATREVTDPDFWWHLRAGQYIFETRSIPHTDIFSFTFDGREWVTHEWLSELVIYAVFRWLGWGGLVAGFALLITAAFALSHRSCEKSGAHPIASWLAVLLGALATAPVWGVRPQMFSLLLASLFLFILTGRMRGEVNRSVWWLPLLMLLWVNLHGGYVLGIVLITIALFGTALDGLMEKRTPAEIFRRVRPLLLVLLVCVAVVPLNPNGARLFTYPFETLASSAMQEHIEEWFSPNFHQARFIPLAVLMFATFASLALSTKRLRVSELLMLCATAYAVLRSGRHLPIFAFAAVPLLAEHATLWVKSQDWSQRLFAPEKIASRRQTLLRFAVLLVALIVSLMNVRHVVAKQAVSEEKHFPARAVEFLREQNLPDPIFNWYDWGGYLIWKLYPERRIYIDGRADVYGDAFLEEFLRATKGQGDWREPLRRNSIRTVIVKPDSPLAGLLMKEEGWSKAFEDGQAIVLVRR